MGESMSFEKIAVESADGVTRITLNNEKTLNALSSRMLRELMEAMTTAANDDGCRVVVLTGAGRGFSSGADLTDTSAPMPMKDGKPDMGAGLRTGYHPILQTIRSMPKPVIAAINGPAAGAGCNLALACDITVAKRSAKLIQAFIKIALVPDAGGTWSIPRLIGRALAMRWMMTGETITAGQAEHWGLLSYVVDDDQFEVEVDRLAKHFATAPTRGLGRIKQLVDASLDNTLHDQLELEADMQTLMGQDQDMMEGMTAFMQKRAPVFKGR